MTILIQNVNNTMAGYQKEILPSSWSPIVKYSVIILIMQLMQIIRFWIKSRIRSLLFILLFLALLTSLQHGFICFGYVMFAFV